MFKYQGKDYYAITRALVATKSGASVQKFGRKELTPKGLGMSPVYKGLDSLTKDIQNKINSIPFDTTYKKTYSKQDDKELE